MLQSRLEIEEYPTGKVWVQIRTPYGCDVVGMKLDKNEKLISSLVSSYAQKENLQEPTELVIDRLSLGSQGGERKQHEERFLRGLQEYLKEDLPQNYKVSIEAENPAGVMR